MQSRYVCPECHRQFVKPGSDLQPFNGTHCPACGGQYLALVHYTPAFPGADYDPKAPDAPRVPQPQAQGPDGRTNQTLLLAESQS